MPQGLRHHQWRFDIVIVKKQIVSKKLNGVVTLITDPPCANSTSFQNPALWYPPTLSQSIFNIPGLAGAVLKLDGVGPVNNRPSPDKLHHFVKKRRRKKRRRKKVTHDM